jgi:hypothetical protein
MLRADADEALALYLGLIANQAIFVCIYACWQVLYFSTDETGR